MESADTIKLLKECDAGTKMSVSSIDEVSESVGDSNLKSLLQESKNHHEELENKICAMLDEYNAEEKDPNPMAKGMSWMKTNVKMAMDNSDATVADLITDGCNMGIQSVCGFMNQYSGASKSSMELAEKIVKTEEKFREELKAFL